MISIAMRVLIKNININNYNFMKPTERLKYD